jgi:transposase
MSVHACGDNRRVEYAWRWITTYHSEASKETAMSKPNGRQKRAIENLAKALRPPPVENLAAALNECFGAAVEAGEQRTRPLLEAQNETLRMIWRQCGGSKDERLPIDD